jgi:hypothetical protein
MIDLQTYFADTVAAGWAPRHPCIAPTELATLETSAVRGDCISPLLIEDDVIYIDRNMQPEPGDVVSFALSQRGADAQNSDLPAGQAPWAADSVWCKLLAVHHDFQMLLDRFGSSATATLMSCESPDDTPVLHPVRNVMREGKLLFTQDSHAGQIGLNAATQPVSSQRTSSLVLGSLSAMCPDVTVVVLSGQTWPVLVQAVANITQASGSSGVVELFEDGVQVLVTKGWGSGVIGVRMDLSYTFSDNLAAGSHTFSFRGASFSASDTCNSASLLVTFLKR